MKINTKMTKIMTIGKDSVGDKIRRNGGDLEEVEAFKYIGVKIHKNGKNYAEIMVYNTVYKPILTYGCESWTLNRRTQSRIQAMEIKDLRAVKRVTKRDKIRDDKIREDVNVESIL
nr:unnamed protein product [Callosobruchus analis]